MKKVGVLTMAVIMIVMGLSLASWAIGDNDGGTGDAVPLDQSTDINWNAYKWMILVVHSNVDDMGTITEAQYTGESASGAGDFGNLESIENNIFVISNSVHGWTLVVEAVEAGSSVPTGGSMTKDDLLEGSSGSGKDRQGGFMLKCTNAPDGNITTYASFDGFGAADQLTVDDRSSLGYKVYDVDYKYEVDVQDEPGDYTVQLKYTATTQ